MIIVLLLIITVGFCGNFWYTEAGVLRNMQFNNPDTNRIVDTEIGVWDYSKIIAEENGSQAVYYLDTNILTNHKLYPESDM